MTRVLDVLVVLVGLAGVGRVAPASASTLTVDRDHVQCPGAQFSSIEAAVQAAAPGDTVVVCPDTYDESVTIDKPLTIQGPGVPGNPGHRKVCTTLAVSDPTTEAIVDGTPTAVFVDSGDVSLSGLVIQGPRSVSATGVLVGPFGDVAVTGNLFQNNVQDIRLTAAAAELGGSSVDGNCFRGLGPQGAGIFGIGVSGAGSNTSVTNNVFFRKGTGLGLNGSSGMSIQNNYAFQDNSFANLQRDFRDSTVSNNVVSAMQSTAISGGGSNVTIANNDIEDGLRDAIAPAGSQLSIHDNVIAGNGGSGIDAQPNTLQDSTIATNLLRQNGNDGIQIEAGNTGNTIADNVARNDGSFDCSDNSVGAGTPAGTANQWINDTGDTENRPGLCD